MEATSRLARCPGRPRGGFHLFVRKSTAAAARGIVGSLSSPDTLSRNQDAAIPTARVRAGDAQARGGVKQWLGGSWRERLPIALTIHVAGVLALFIFTVYQAALSASLLVAGVAALALGSGLAIARSWVLRRS